MEKSIYVILDNIRSLYNIGAIFRSADAFGVKKIYLCGISGNPIERQMNKIGKTALGAEKSVPWEYCRQTSRLVKKLKEEGLEIVALEIGVGQRRALPLQKFKPTLPIALIVGNEVTGISKKILKLADKIVYIPMRGRKESLNVAIAASIAIYQIKKVL